MDHRPFMANIQTFHALAVTLPVGGLREYLLRQRNMIIGQKMNKIVGSVNDSQKPTYFSA
jgi:hypothetical protein